MSKSVLTTCKQKGDHTWPLGVRKAATNKPVLKKKKTGVLVCLFVFFFHYASFSLSTEFGMRNIYLKGIDISLDF